MIILSTGSLYSYGMARVFALAAETGYDGMEILIDNRWDSRDADYLRRLSGDHHLPVIALHSPFVADVQGWANDQIRRLERTIELAVKLKASVIVIHLPFRLYAIWGQVNFFNHRRFMLPLPLIRRDRFYHFIRDGGLEELASSSGVTIALENMPARRFLTIPINAYWFNSPERLQRFAHVALDTTHVGTWGLDPADVYNRLRRKVAHIHLSNFDGKEHRPPQTGDLPLAGFLRRLAADRYPGAISVETSPDAMCAGDENQCRLALKRALTFCRDNFAVDS